MSEARISALSVGNDSQIAETATRAQDRLPGETAIGDGTTIHGGTTIYRMVKTGNEFSTGHNTLIREHCVLGDNVPSETLATGTPVHQEPLPAELDSKNRSSR